MASPGEISEGDQFRETSLLKLMLKMVFLHGSQPRPPEIRSDLFLRCTLTGLVYLRYQNSLSKHLASGYVSVHAVVVIWRSSESKCGFREMRIRLGSIQRSLGYVVDDRWLDMLFDHPDFTLFTQLVSRECNTDCSFLIYDLCKFTRFRFYVESYNASWVVVHELCMISEGSFRHHNHSRKRESLKFALDISCLDLLKVDYYVLLPLESLVCDVGIKMFMSFRGLRMIAPHVADNNGFHATVIAALVQHLSLLVKTKACCFEVLLTFGIERLLQFHSCVAAYMRRMKRRSSLSDRLLQFHSYVEAPMGKMERRSPLVDVIMLISFLKQGNGLSSKWVDLQVRIASQICVSRRKLWPTLVTLLHEVACIFAEKGLCLQHELLGWLQCFLYVLSQIQADVVFALSASPKLLLTQSLLQPHLRCPFTLLFIVWNQAFFCLCQECDGGAFHCWLECYELLLPQNFPPIFLHRQSHKYDFIGHVIVARYSWFGSILEFLYGSLPRPPDVFKSKMEF